jgi:hypothetical protein
MYDLDDDLQRQDLAPLGVDRLCLDVLDWSHARRVCLPLT